MPPKKKETIKEVDKTKPKLNTIGPESLVAPMTNSIKEYEEARKALEAKVKPQIIDTLETFFSKYGNFVEEIMIFHRTSEYSDDGSSASTGHMEFRLTEIAKKILGRAADELLGGSAHSEEFDEAGYQGFSYWGSEDKKLKSNLAKLNPAVGEALYALKLVSTFFGGIPEETIGSIFGKDKIVLFTKNGELKIRDFYVYSDDDPGEWETYA